MNILIVHAHPEPLSFCSALKDLAANRLTGAGHQVQVSDLYALDWDPVARKSDFNQTGDASHFRYNREQGTATGIGGHEAGFPGYAEPIAAEMKKLALADVLILNFPIWWFGLPAILKGWVDKVFALNFAYQHANIYAGGPLGAKTGFCCVTTGGLPQLYGADGANGDIDMLLYPVNHGILFYTGMRTLPQFTAHAPHRVSAEERTAYLAAYTEYLDNLDRHKPLW